jgi:triosephosphate isomerase (TIM)
MNKNPYIIGNWKMYKTAREATDYIETLAPKVEGVKANIYLAVPFTSISPASHYAKETNLVIGAQNMNDAREGAFTGEIAALMLKEAGAAFVLLGHSERRLVFGETDAFIRRKVLRALQDDLQPVLCIGETQQERSANQTEEVLRRQLLSALEEVPKEEAGRLIIAYEPVWAIGTGKAATSKDIEHAHSFCRSLLEELFGKRKGGTIPILYGGSVKLENIAELIQQKEIDGVLVGGASLEPEIFIQIIHHVIQTPQRKVRRKKE